jgi:hypothetical protein
MSEESVEVQGMVQADGTLVLDRRLELPPGRVRVTVQPATPAEAPDLARFQAMMAQIWAGQKARGHVPRTKEEIDAEIREMREEAEQELQAAERLHEECQRARQGSGE